MILMINKNYLNKKSCSSLFCNAWCDQTDIFLQIATKSCHRSLKCSIGTFLGSPSGIEINNLMDPIIIRLVKCWINDKLNIDCQINIKR